MRILDKLDAIDISSITPEIAEQVKAIDEEWKTIGMIPKESIESVNERFNTKMNQFTSAQAATDEALSKQLAKIKAQKQEMIEKVKQFAESAGSNQLADAVRDLQKD